MRPQGCRLACDIGKIEMLSSTQGQRGSAGQEGLAGRPGPQGELGLVGPPGERGPPGQKVKRQKLRTTYFILNRCCMLQQKEEIIASQHNISPCWFRENPVCQETGGSLESKAWRGLQVTRAGKATTDPKDNQ